MSPSIARGALWRSGVVVLGGLCLASPAHATFSIVACEPETGVCGVAVATHNLAVGNSVPFARYGVGAGVSQFETNACHAPAMLQALKDNVDASGALDAALEAEANCDDGLDKAYRQVALVTASGDFAAHTGNAAGGYAGHLGGEFVSVQGNGLASAAVLEAMLQTFETSDAPLAERLLDALEAGHKAGGQSIGVLSAALRVATPQGWPVDIDLRVDFAHGTAVSELRRLYDASLARQLLFRAARTESENTAAALIARAAVLAPDWDRIQLRAARLASRLGRPRQATVYACRFREINPEWARRLANELDFGACPAP
ncbi:MAG: DUF1028 domain-containing protein [Pseudomonadota bacterium]